MAVTNLDEARIPGSSLVIQLENVGNVEPSD